MDSTSMAFCSLMLVCQVASLMQRAEMKLKVPVFTRAIFTLSVVCLHKNVPQKQQQTDYN